MCTFVNLKCRLLTVIALIAVFLVLQPWQSTLYFHHGLIDDGQVWRWFTAHWVHTNTWHIALNAAGLMVYLLLMPTQGNPLQLIRRVVLISILVSVGLYATPNLIWYAGFSGVLYGLFTLSALEWLILRNAWMAAIILLLTVGKTVWDMHWGEVTLSSRLIEAPVIYLAHVYGIAAGVVCALPSLYCWVSRES